MNCMMVPSAFCPAVDNRRYKRILYEVSDHDTPPTRISGAFSGPVHGLGGTRLDPLRCRHRWLGALSCTPQGGVREGAASNLPVSYRRRGGESGSGGCGQRKGLAATQPKLPKGRPSTPAAKAAARTKKRLAAQGAALFTHRYLFVQRHLNKTERKTLWRVSRGLPQTRATGHHGTGVYVIRSALSDPDRSGQTGQTAATAPRFPPVGETLKKLFAPTLDKALTFLDDTLLPSTSNAVSGATGAIARCKKVPGCETQAQESVPAWPWICGVKPKPKAVNKPSPHSIVHGLDKPGVFTTVSVITLLFLYLTHTADGFTYSFTSSRPIAQACS